LSGEKTLATDCLFFYFYYSNERKREKYFFRFNIPMLLTVKSLTISFFIFKFMSRQAALPDSIQIFISLSSLPSLCLPTLAAAYLRSR